MCHAWRFIEIHGALAAPTVIGVLHVDIPRADPRNLSRRALAVQLRNPLIFQVTDSSGVFCFFIFGSMG